MKRVLSEPRRDIEKERSWVTLAVCIDASISTRSTASTASSTSSSTASSYMEILKVPKGEPAADFGSRRCHRGVKQG